VRDGPTGVLLVNLGTPDAPQTAEVRRYLREFLSDPRVIDINPVVRWFILNLFILPMRPRRSAEAYRKVWTDEGSPLLVHGNALLDGVRKQLSEPDFHVELAMRYGNPSMKSGMQKLLDRGCDQLVVFPLYPQFASSTTGSTVEHAWRVASELWNTPFINVVPAFYDDPRFVEAFVQVARKQLDELDPDHVLFSFHGLPERHIRKSDPSGKHCLATEDCCASMCEANRNCYRAQCFATARAIAVKLGLDDAKFDVAFQSRLGRDPWIQPYTDETVKGLPKKGRKRLAVFCPAFVADCLETIEEIGMEARDLFLEGGGEDFALIESLNAHQAWIDAVVSLTRDCVNTRRPALPPAKGEDEAQAV
jgi:ferrochelatase